jgi:hypothetical protein
MSATVIPLHPPDKRRSGRWQHPLPEENSQTGSLTFPKTNTSSSTLQDLRESMLRRWREGLRPPQLQHAVRDDVPYATRAEFNAAADEAWREICRAEWGLP